MAKLPCGGLAQSRLGTQAYNVGVHSEIDTNVDVPGYLTVDHMTTHAMHKAHTTGTRAQPIGPRKISLRTVDSPMILPSRSMADSHCARVNGPSR